VATTLLEGVNKVLLRIGEITSVSPELTTLTDSARQRQIDLTVQLWQDVMEYVQGWADLPGDIGSGTITLVTDTREYAVASDFQGFVGDDKGIAWLINTDYRLGPYPGGYKQMFVDQIDPSLFTGQAGSWAYNPVTEQIRLDRTPTANENGDVLTYLYDKKLTLSAATDNFPIPDGAVNVLALTVAEVYKLSQKGRITGDVWKIGAAEALRISSRAAKGNTYG